MWQKLNRAEIVSDLTDQINDVMDKTYYRYEDERNEFWCEINKEQEEMIKRILETILGLNRNDIKDSTEISIHLCGNCSWIDILKEED